jgi:Zn-dependent peptidase ImmA (M78 family)/transcriptional regulator with XRE-family HTH domain
VRIGTPGFDGARLREAREARSLTATALAGLAGVSKITVSHYENGMFAPSPETLERIADTLNLPVEFFLRPAPPPPPELVFWRSMSAATKASRVRARRRLGWLVEIVDALREYVEVPAVNFPKLAVPANPFDLTPTLLEGHADAVRRYWGLGDKPISNVAWLLENNGAIVTRSDLDSRTLDAFSTWLGSPKTPYIVLGADKGAAVRSRFDAAHELAHLVLHGHILASRLGTAADFKVLEQQANRFAGAFLLPRETFAADLRSLGRLTLDALRLLKPKWGTSLQLMVKRGEDLGLITPEEGENLWRSLSRRGWRTVEPLDDRIPIEEPRVLQRAFELLLTESMADKASIRALVPLSIGDIEELIGLPQGYLADMPPNVRMLRVPRQLPLSSPDTGRRGQIVAFPGSA